MNPMNPISNTLKFCEHAITWVGMKKMGLSLQKKINQCPIQPIAADSLLRYFTEFLFTQHLPILTAIFKAHNPYISIDSDPVFSLRSFNHCFEQHSLIVDLVLSIIQWHNGDPDKLGETYQDIQNGRIDISFLHSPSPSTTLEINNLLAVEPLRSRVHRSGVRIFCTIHHNLPLRAIVRHSTVSDVLLMKKHFGKSSIPYTDFTKPFALSELDETKRDLFFSVVEEEWRLLALGNVLTTLDDSLTPPPQFSYFADKIKNIDPPIDPSYPFQQTSERRLRVEQIAELACNFLIKSLLNAFARREEAQTIPDSLTRLGFSQAKLAAFLDSRAIENLPKGRCTSSTQKKRAQGKHVLSARGEILLEPNEVITTLTQTVVPLLFKDPKFCTTHALQFKPSSDSKTRAAAANNAFREELLATEWSLYILLKEEENQRPSKFLDEDLISSLSQKYLQEVRCVMHVPSLLDTTPTEYEARLHALRVAEHARLELLSEPAAPGPSLPSSKHPKRKGARSHEKPLPKETKGSHPSRFAQNPKEFLNQSQSSFEDDDKTSWNTASSSKLPSRKQQIQKFIQRGLIPDSPPQWIVAPRVGQWMELPDFDAPTIRNNPLFARYLGLNDTALYDQYIRHIAGGSLLPLLNLPAIIKIYARRTVHENRRTGLPQPILSFMGTLTTTSSETRTVRINVAIDEKIDPQHPLIYHMVADPCDHFNCILMPCNENASIEEDASSSPTPTHHPLPPPQVTYNDTDDCLTVTQTNAAGHVLVTTTLYPLYRFLLNQSPRN